MKILLIICAMIVTGGASTRFVLSICSKRPLWTMAILSGLEIVALGFIFRFWG